MSFPAAALFLTIKSSTMVSFYLMVTAGLLLAAQQILRGTFLVGAQNTNFSFPYFNTTDSFLMIGDVMHDVQTSTFTLTPEGAALFQGSCGKLFYKEPVRMKDSTSGAVASFHTAFTFQILGWQNNWQYADGITFTFCHDSNLNQFFDDATGFGDMFCLLSNQYNGIASNRLFAIEFDTYRNTEQNDISDNHIGVDINGVKSAWYYNLCGGTLKNCTYLCNGGYFTAWIDYDNATQKLEVFFANGSLTTGIPKPPNPLINVSLALDIQLGELVDDYMYVGFTAGTGVTGELHQIQSWTFTSAGMPELELVSHNGRSKIIRIVPGVFSAGTVAALVLLVFFTARNQKQGKINLADQNQVVAREFTYKELSKATKNFSKSELLGSGGSGKVYMGTLPSGVLVAVKRLKHGIGEESFEAEIISLGEIEPHRNLVALRGWCREKERFILVYEYMSNGSLDEWLFGLSKRRRNRKRYASNLDKDETLPLDLRYSVLRGVAAALLHLHEECEKCVLHRDVKSSNVLLDGFWTARLGDFGLARLVTHRTKVEKATEGGTPGYMAPEIPHTGIATKESDVYSFGVLILEVVCGTRPGGATAGEGTMLVDKVWEAHEAGNILQVVDSRLRTFPPSTPTPTSGGELQDQASSVSIRNPGPSDESQETSHRWSHTRDAALKDVRLTRNLLHLGLVCCDPNPEDRPAMGVVSQGLQLAENVLEMCLPGYPLPARKPEAHYGEGAHSRR